MDHCSVQRHVAHGIVSSSTRRCTSLIRSTQLYDMILYQIDKFVYCMFVLLLLVCFNTQTGFGNWTEIADHVGTKTKSKCQQHFENVYIQSKNAPLPVCVLHNIIYVCVCVFSTVCVLFLISFRMKIHVTL